MTGELFTPWTYRRHWHNITLVKTFDVAPRSYESLFVWPPCVVNWTTEYNLRQHFRVIPTGNSSFIRRIFRLLLDTNTAPFLTTGTSRDKGWGEWLYLSSGQQQKKKPVHDLLSLSFTYSFRIPCMNKRSESSCCLSVSSVGVETRDTQNHFWTFWLNESWSLY